ncbi:hypothetical protein A9B99_08890 [Mangrovibacter phragmitis]|uniref:Uncharacterized protein n=1 Tax=Mangrovibacter phragmitis TaxID=1691903 RepID=A0A1B7L1Z9_9ENTR|nr:hypothetical protein A9B99_08890 [Mangrovibacter phragmitis]
MKVPFTWTDAKVPFTWTDAKVPFTWTDAKVPFIWTDAKVPFIWTDAKVPFTSSDVVNVTSQPVNVLRGPPLNNPVFRGQPVLRTAFTSGQSACGRLDSASMPRFALFRHPGGITLSSFLRFTGLTRTVPAASDGLFVLC